MAILEYYKICPECHENFDARRLNQKFCDLTCKTRYNNRKLHSRYHSRKNEDQICKETNSILFKNRQILKQFEGKTVKLEDLKKLGFVLQYITQFEYTDDHPKTFFYCYDMKFEFIDKFNLKIFNRT